MIRKFRLYNARKDLIDLTDNNDFLVFNPRGLGVSFSNDFEGVGSNFLIKESEIQQSQLELLLLLGGESGEGYKRYFEFVEFLNHTPYTLEYETDGAAYKRDCILSEISKEELRASRTLQETFVLDFTTPFYIERSERTTNNPPIEGKSGKIYETVTRKRQVFESVPESYQEGDLWHWQGELGILNSENRKNTKVPREIKNGIVNGDFSQGLSKWRVSYCDVILNKNEARLTSVIGTYPKLINELDILTINDVYYASIYIMDTTFKRVNIQFGSTNYSNRLASYGVNDAKNGKTLSGIAKNTQPVSLFSVSGDGTTPEEYLVFKNPMLINLTQTFGAGNEPTQEEMDELITLLGGWFDGTVTVPRYFIATKSSNEFNFNDFVYYGQSANENTYYDKIYDYTYSFDDYPVETEESYYTYDYVYADEDEGKNVFQVDNHSVYIGSSKHSPCEITIYGPCENPHWQVTQGSKILQSDGFNLTVPEGHRLVVSSNPQSQRAVLIALDGTVSNVYQQQDLSKSNFVTFPVGRSKILFFNCDKVSFRYREERVTV